MQQFASTVCLKGSELGPLLFSLCIVQVTKDRRDAVKLSGPCDESGCSILDGLELRQQKASSTSQQTITIVQSTTNKYIYQCLGSIHRYWISDYPELAQLEKAKFTDTFDSDLSMRTHNNWVTWHAIFICTIFVNSIPLEAKKLSCLHLCNVKC